MILPLCALLAAFLFAGCTGAAGVLEEAGLSAETEPAYTGEVAFSDPVFERLIREALELPTGAVDAETLARAETLYIVGDHAYDTLPDYACAEDGYTLDGERHITRGALNNLTDLKYFTRLKTLHIVYTNVSDLAPVMELTRLRDLALPYNQIAALPSAENMAALRNVNLAGNPVRDVSPLADAPLLRALALTDTPVTLTETEARLLFPNAALTVDEFDYVVKWHDRRFEKLVRQLLGGREGSIRRSELDGVTSLAIIGPFCTDAGDAFFADREIKFESASRFSVADDTARSGRKSYGRTWLSNLADLAHFRNLTSFTLYMTRVSDLSALSSMHNLTSVTLGYNRVSDLSPLAALPHLEKLSVIDTSLRSFDRLGALTGLVSLEAQGSRISDVSALSALTRLRTLSLSGNRISDVSPLASLTGVSKLDLSDNRISDLAPLAEMQGLTELNLAGNQARKLDPLTQLGNLKSLWINGNPVRSAEPLAEMGQLSFLCVDKSGKLDADALRALLPNASVYVFEP